MNNLLAEMRRFGVSVSDIQRLLGCTEKTVRNKLNGHSDFVYWEAEKIRDTFFPNQRLEYLFSNEECRGRGDVCVSEE